jgi:DNA-binding GntR family transcriptional regulator
MSALDQPVLRQNLRELARDRIRTAVLSGELNDERITEGALAERLGTSRAPIREVLHELEQQGLVESLGLRGYRVKVLSPAEVRELMLVRMALERLAISMNGRPSATTLERLAKLAAQMRAAPQDPARLDELDTQFHGALVEGADSPLLLRTWQGMRDQLRLAIHASNTSFGDPAGTADSHDRLVAALRDAPEAGTAAIEAHINGGLARFERQLADPG